MKSGSRVVKSTFFAVAVAGVLGSTAPLAVRAAEPPAVHSLVVKVDDMPAYLREIETLQALYKQQGLSVKIDVYRGLYSGSSTGNIDVLVRVANLAALARMEELARTQPQLAAQTKKVDALQKVQFSTIYNQVVP